MPIGIGVVANGDLKPIFQRDETRHRKRARAVHPDPAVVIDAHESKRGVDSLVDDRELQAVARRNGLPVRQRRAAQRVHANRHTSAADRLHVDDAAEVVHVREDKILLVDRWRAERRLERDALRCGVARLEQLVGASLNPSCDARFRGTAVRRVVLEPSILGRVVRRGDDDAVGEMIFT